MKKFIMLLMGVFLATSLVGCSCGKKEFTVTFDSNGGSSVASQVVEKDDTAVKPTDPTRDGFIFDEWLLNGEPFDFTTPITADITLEASWVDSTTAEVYKVTFNVDGEITTIDVLSGNQATKPANPTKEGYTFLGWYLDDEAFDFTTPITSDITLVARFSENEEQPDEPAVKKYTVTFDSNGGSKVASKTVNEGSTVSKPANPTRSGYTFVGWQLNGKDYNFSTKVTSNITLVAKWEKNPAVKKYTVTFDSNGGSKVASKTVNEGSTVSKPANPTRSGYTFVGWQLNGKDYNFSTKVTSNITLVAKWEKNPSIYTMTYTPYDAFSPFGIIQIYEDGKVIAFDVLLNSEEDTVAEYSSKANGANNANEYIYSQVAKVKLTDGTIVNITK